MINREQSSLDDIDLGNCDLQEDGHCIACQHRCAIIDGKSGLCGVRSMKDGRLKCIRNYISYARSDPVERKPIFHYRPGTRVYSIGTVGCNFKCDFCQNHDISFEFDGYPMTYATPSMVVKKALGGHADGVAFTFNEPTVSLEYFRDVARLARKKGLYCVLVTNGYLTREAIEYINPHIDAYIVGVKTFDEGFYSRACGASLKRLSDSIRMLSGAAKHMELSYLVRNDDASFEDFLSFYGSLNRQHPLHLGKFFPEHKSSEGETTTEKLIHYHDLARRRGLPYVYVSDLYGSRYESTYCPGCGTLAIERSGSMGDPSISVHCSIYEVVSNNLVDGNRCRACGERLDILYE